MYGDRGARRRKRRKWPRVGPKADSLCNRHWETSPGDPPDVTHLCFRAGNRASGPDFGRSLIGKASKSALKHYCATYGRWVSGPLWKQNKEYPNQVLAALKANMKIEYIYIYNPPGSGPEPAQNPRSPWETDSPDPPPGPPRGGGAKTKIKRRLKDS